jgi:serine/threonine-protein kinase HipA
VTSPAEQALAEELSLTAEQGRTRMRHIAQSLLTQWEQLAQRAGIPKREIRMMAESIQPRIEAVLKAAGT